MSGLRATVLADSPFAAWWMGIASPYADGSGNGNPLTAGSGTPTQVPAIVPGDDDADAGSLHSTGSEYLTLPFPGSATNFSFELWVQTSGACTIWGSYPNCYGGIDGSGRIFLTVVGGSTYTGSVTTLADGNLHHLVWTFSSGTLQMYVDGSTDGTGSAPASLATGSLFGYGSAPWLTGSLGDVASYSTTLSGGQVSAHWTAGSVGPLHLTASDSMAAITETGGRLVALGRAFSNTLAALADLANSHQIVSLSRTATDTTPIITDSARVRVVGAVEAQFHPEIVFKVFDLYTKEYFGMLPLDAVTFQCRYNSQIGTLQGSLSLDPAPAAALRPEAIRLRRMLIVEINEWPLWAGLTDSFLWDSDTSAYRVHASELWSIYDAWPLSDDLVYTNIDEIAILRDLIAWITSQTGGSFGVTYSTPLSDINRNLTIIGSNNGLLGNIVRAHGTSIFDGYQVRGPRVLYDDATQTPRLLLEAASPTLGNRYNGNTPRFRYLPTGGEVIKVSFEDNAATAAGYATEVHGTSILSGNPAPAPLTAVAVNTALVAAGWPPSIYVLPAVQDYNQSTLQARVDAEMWRRATVYGAPSVTITLAALWRSQLLPGDDAVFVFHDGLRWPTKKVYVYRVTGIDVDVEAETALLVLDASSVGELVDEVLTQMSGTTNQNPSNGPASDPVSTYYPSGQGPGPNLPTGYPSTGGGIPPFTQLIFRANQDSLEGATTSFAAAPGAPGGPYFSNSGPVGAAGLPGFSVVDGRLAWVEAIWQGTLTGAGIPVTLEVGWFASGTATIVARDQIEIQAGANPAAFSVSLAYNVPNDPSLGSLSSYLAVVVAAGSWAIMHLDAEELYSSLAAI